MIPFLLLALAAADPTSTRSSMPADTEAPIIEDLAAAASNPDAAPVITVMLSDRGTGVGTAFVFFRGLGAAGWQKAEAKGGTSGLFIARLPDGLQRSGFDYYVEATDVAGNGPARIGSPEAPIRVEHATEATLRRIERQEANVLPPPAKIHPAWLMLSLGVGVVASAGTGAYLLDLSGTNKKIGEVDANLARPNLSDASRALLTTQKTSLQQAGVQDTVIASVLGVVGVAGIITGGTLVVLSSLE